MAKYVYTFGNGTAEGDRHQKNLLGGKRAGLAEMARLGLPVPAEFIITTECCTDYFDNDCRYPPSLNNKAAKAMRHMEYIMNMKFGDSDAPLLVSCRSGARASMPGMMETVLNVCLTTKTIPGIMIKIPGTARFMYDGLSRCTLMW